MDDLESNFNLKIVLVSFKQCLNEKQEVLLDHYLAGWRGLVRYIWGALPCGASPKGGASLATLTSCCTMGCAYQAPTYLGWSAVLSHHLPGSTEPYYPRLKVDVCTRRWGAVSPIPCLKVYFPLEQVPEQPGCHLLIHL